MSANLPMTLKQVREHLQHALDGGDQQASTYYIQLLERCKVTINYVQETDLDKIERTHEAIRNLFINRGMTKFDVNNLIKANPLQANETAQQYFDRFIEVPQVKGKLTRG